MNTKKIAVAIYVLLINSLLHAQQAPEVQDTRMVGIVSFAPSNIQDSLTANNIYSAVSRILVQTKRFTVLEEDRCKQMLVKTEINRQKSADFLEREIVESGKMLGAKILVIGTVSNSELYQDAGHYAARVDYNLKFVDVETDKTIAASSFKGDSENFMNAGFKAGKGLERIIMSSAIINKGDSKTVHFASTAFSALSEGEKNTIKGKLIDAIEATAEKVNVWVRGTFNFNLLFLKVIDEDKKKSAQSVLIEGGKDIGMKEGYKLKMVLVTETETSRGKIRDEEPIAELQIEEVRAQTSKCKVINGGKRVLEGADNKNMRIVFN